MVLFERKQYLQQLISAEGNGMIKIITGIRRRGKRSYMLTPVNDSGITITPELEQKIGEARRQYKNRETIVCNTKEELHDFLDSL